jgi:hypothetical protein
MTAREARTGGGPAVRYRSRRLAIPGGEILELKGDGTIERRDAVGAVLGSWTPDDPAWADRAVRFGLHASALTVPPRGRYVPGAKPPL